ncbi:hypothetical protein Tco_0880249 [Tanacetum coccineum]
MRVTYHWGPKHQRFYGYATNMETSKDVYSRHIIIAVISLKIMKFYSYSHLEEITIRRQDDVLYKFREGDFKRLRRQDIEDMLLLIVQGKLTNLSLDDRYALNVAVRMYTRRIIIQERMEDLQLADCDGIPKRPAMFLNLWRYKVVRHRYSNPIIQPELEGSTQGYLLVSVEVLRIYTSAGNPVKEILLKLNLPDHRIRKRCIKVKEFQRSFRHSDTERLSRSDEVLKLKNFKKDATLKLSKSTNQEWYEHVGPEVTRSQDDKVTRWQNEIILG